MLSLLEAARRDMSGCSDFGAPGSGNYYLGPDLVAIDARADARVPADIVSD
jgi:hypothetical protein